MTKAVRANAGAPSRDPVARRRRVLAAAAAGLLLVAAAVALWAWERQAQLSRYVPDPIPLPGWSPELETAVAANTRAARAGWHRATALAKLASLYHANGFYQQALACYYGLAAFAPDEARWPHRIAAILSTYGQLDEAVPYWQEAVRLRADDVPAALQLASTWLKLNERAKAETVYRGVLARDPDNRYAHLGLGRIAADAGDWPEARRELESAVRLSAAQLGADLLVTVYEHEGLATAAVELRGRAKTAPPYTDPVDRCIEETYDDCYDPYRLMLLAGALQGRGEAARGIRLLERAARLRPSDGPIHFQLALAYWQGGDLVRAEAELRACTQVQPGFSDGWLKLSELRTVQHDAAGSDAILARGLGACPASPALHLELGRRRAAAGRLEDALAEFRIAARLRPQEAEAHIAAARALFALGQVDDGTAEMQAALAAEPENPAAICTLAVAAIARGDRVEAISYLRMAAAQPRIGGEQRADLVSRFQARFGATPE